VVKSYLKNYVVKIEGKKEGKKPLKRGKKVKDWTNQDIDERSKYDCAVTSKKRISNEST